MKNLFRFTMDRRAYVVATVCYLVVFGLVLRMLPGFPARTILPAVWVLFIGAPRLRDIGWSAWWSLLPFGVGFLVGFLKGFAHAAHMAAEGLVVTLGPVIVGWVSILFLVVLAFPKGGRGDAGRDQASSFD